MRKTKLHKKWNRAGSNTKWTKPKESLYITVRVYAFLSAKSRVRKHLICNNKIPCFWHHMLFPPLYHLIWFALWPYKYFFKTVSENWWFHTKNTTFSILFPFTYIHWDIHIHTHTRIYRYVCTERLGWFNTRFLLSNWKHCSYYQLLQVKYTAVVASKKWTWRSWPGSHWAFNDYALNSSCCCFFTRQSNMWAMLCRNWYCIFTSTTTWFY